MATQGYNQAVQLLSKSDKKYKALFVRDLDDVHNILKWNNFYLFLYEYIIFIYVRGKLFIRLKFLI